MKESYVSTWDNANELYWISGVFGTAYIRIIFNLIVIFLRAMV